VGRVAEVQYGLVTRDQLLASGLRPGAIAHRVKTGALCRLLPGVFSIGHQPLGGWASEAAALLSIGADCVISHASAAAIWGLSSRPADGVQVTVIARHPRPRSNVEIHRVPHLDPRDVRLRQRLPVTAPARTVIDLAGLERDATLERALAEARVAGLVDDADLEAAIERAPGRPGVATVKRILELESGRARSRSEAERRFMALVAAARLAAPATNVRLSGYEVDFLWAVARLVVEVDGHRYHGHRAAFERDRLRDQVLVASGYRVVRVTWRQLVDEPFALVARIAQALGA
jgi:very-short-patch-repair endonuclease